VSASFAVEGFAQSIARLLQPRGQQLDRTFTERARKSEASYDSRNSKVFKPEFSTSGIHGHGEDFHKKKKS